MVKSNLNKAYDDAMMHIMIFQILMKKGNWKTISINMGTSENNRNKSR